MKKNIKPYTSVLRRYRQPLVVLTFFKNWMKAVSAKKGNATFFIKTLIFIIFSPIHCQHTSLDKICGQVNNFFLRNLSKSYSLFRWICYICRRVWGNWGVAFYKMMIIIAVALMDYLKQMVNPFGSGLYYAEVKLITLISNRFSPYLYVNEKC